MTDMPPSLPTSPSANPGAIAVLVSALLGGLAGGVAWCFLSLWLPWHAQFWIVPIGVLIALSSRWQGYRDGTAVVCAALAIGVAFVYGQYLFGAVRIADSMGLPLREALFKAGFGLTADARSETCAAAIGSHWRPRCWPVRLWRNFSASPRRNNER